jgi:membrane protein required for colicin V production
VTTLDIGVLVLVGLSTLFAFMRGVIRELIALVAWVVGIVAGLAFTPVVGAWLPETLGNPAIRYFVAFTLILIAALFLGAIIAWPIARVVRAAGLGFVDRFLGSIFGLARGLLLAVAFTLFAGLTSLPRSSWWQDSVLAGPLVAAALVAAAYLPRDWAEALDYSSSGRKAAPGEQKV